MSTLRDPSFPIKPASATPTCTCPDDITDTGDLCGTCLAEYQDWRWECDRHQSDPEPEPDDGYPDEAPTLPDYLYYEPDEDDLASIFASNPDGGCGPSDDDPFEESTFSALEYFNTYLDPTDDLESSEAQARGLMERG